MEAKNNRKFKSLFLDQSFQIRFIIILLMSVAMLSTLYFIAFQYFFMSFETMGYKVGLPSDHVFFQFLSKQKRQVFILMIEAFSIVSVISVFLGYWFSHKIAGPLHRLKVCLEDMEKSKKLKPIAFREKDLFLDIPEKFNSLVKSLEKD